MAKRSPCRPTSVYRAFTLPEILVSTSVMLMLFTALFFICQQATSAMLKGTAQSELLSDLQVLSRRLNRAVQGGPAVSFSLAADGSGISLLSAEDADGRFQYDAVISQARWQKYLVIYHQPSSRSLQLVEVPVVGRDEERSPGPIEAFDDSDPLQTYFVGGRPLLSHVDEVDFAQPEAAVVSLTLKLSRARSSRTPERLSMTMLANFRN